MLKKFVGEKTEIPVLGEFRRVDLGLYIRSIILQYLTTRMNFSLYVILVLNMYSKSNS